MHTWQVLKYLLTGFVLTLSSLCVYGIPNQDRVDSLKNHLSVNLTEKQRFETLIGLGNAYQIRSLDSAYLYTQAALALAKNASFQDSAYIHIHNLLGRTFANRGIFDKAMSQYIAGLKIAEELDDKSLYIKLLINMGIVHFRLGDFAKSENMYLKSIRLIQEYSKNHTFQRKQYYLSSVYNNLAIIYENRRDTVKIMQYYDTALMHSVANNDKRNISLILNNIGNIQLNQKQFDKAYKNITESLKIRIEQNDSKGIGQNYDNLGRYYFRTGKFDSALFYFRKGLEISGPFGSLTDVISMHKGIMAIYDATGQFEKSLNEHRLYEALNDSLYNLRRAMEIADMEAAYDFEKQQALNDLELKKKRFSTILIISLIFCLTVIVSMWIIFYLKLQKRSTERKHESLSLSLEYKNKEMATKALYQFKKQELINRVIQQLKDLSDQLETKQGATIVKVIKNLEQGTNDETWTEFELLFNETHQDFYKTLEAEYPNLTPNEKRLCAFIKLNMTSKEISSLTGQTVRSIIVARSRLRKKLQLTNIDTSLVDFLASV